MDIIFCNSTYSQSTIQEGEQDLVCRKQEQLLLMPESCSIYLGFSEGTDHQAGEYLTPEKKYIFFQLLYHHLSYLALSQFFKLPQLSRTTWVLDIQNGSPVPHQIHSEYLLIR